MRKPHLGILLKPTSHDCNMACDYCYYEGVHGLYPDVERPRMSIERRVEKRSRTAIG